MSIAKKVLVSTFVVGAILVGALHIYSEASHGPPTCPHCDVNGDGHVDFTDVNIVLDHFGEEYLAWTATPTSTPTPTATPTPEVCGGDCGEPRNFCDVTGPWAHCNDYRQLGASGDEVPFPPATEDISFDCLDATKPGYDPGMLEGTLPFPCAFSKFEHFMTRMESDTFGQAILRLHQPVDIPATGERLIQFDADLKGLQRNYFRLMLSPNLTKRVSDDRSGGSRYPLTFLDMWFQNGGVHGTICHDNVCVGDSYPFGDAFGSSVGTHYVGTDNVRDRIQVYVSQSSIRVLTNGNERVNQAITLNFDTAYLYLTQVSYNPCKDGQCSVAEQIFHWDNVAFDGPVLPLNGLTPSGSQDVVFNKYDAESCTVAGVAAALTTGHDAAYTWQTWVARMPVQAVTEADVSCVNGPGGGMNQAVMGFEVVSQ